MSSNKILTLSLLINVLFLLFIGVIAYRYNWVNKIPEKLGWREQPKSQDFLTTISWNHTMESIEYEADIVFFGASITSNGKWEKYFDSLKVCNLGKSGDKLETMLWRVPQTAAVHPRKIFLAMEQNDMHDLLVDEIEKAYNVLLDSIIKSNPQATIYLESLLPLNECQFKRVCDNKKIKKVNEIIRRVAAERGIQYIDIYSIYEQDGHMSMAMSTDGQHLKPEAYGRWVEALRPYIDK